MSVCLLNHTRYEVKSILYRGRGALEGVAIHGFGYRVFAQSQRDIFDLFDRVRERRNTRGVHGLHLLDEPEEVIQALERIAGLGVGQFEAREMRDALHIVQGQGHAVTGKLLKLRQCAKTVLQQRFIAPDLGMEESLDEVKNCHSDPAKQAKL